MKPTTPNPLEVKDTPPPILGSWKRLYTTILVLHAIIISLIYLFTRYYS